MKNLDLFSSSFHPNSKALEMALVIRDSVQAIFPHAQEGFYGGAKVKMVLYSIESPNQVICGIQTGKEDSCILYVHHINELNHPRLAFGGK